MKKKLRVPLFTSGYLGSSGVLFPFFKLEIGELIFLRLGSYDIVDIFGQF